MIYFIADTHFNHAKKWGWFGDMEIKIKLGVNTTYMSKIQKIFVKILHK